MASGPYLIQIRMAEMLPPGCPIRRPADQSQLRLPADFRSLLRPSSPDGAKASVVCPYTLDRKKTDLSGSRCIRCNSFYPKTMLFSRNFRIRRPAMRGPRSRGQNLQEHTSETPARGAVVGVTGIGPVTSSLSGTRSNQLSYTPRHFQCRMLNAECRMMRCAHIVHRAL